MTISIACDHGGYDLKEKVKEHLLKNGFEVIDMGCHGIESCDYPDFGSKAAIAVAKGRADKGIVICTTGVGMSIVANKIKGVRAALCWNENIAKMSRRHNDSNVLALGAINQEDDHAFKIVDVFLTTPFEGGRHQRRVDKMMNLHV